MVSGETTSTVWGTHELPEEGDVTLGIGPLGVTLRRRPEEVWVATSYDEVGPGVPREWTRWAAADNQAVTLQPVLPDRPAVVAPEVPFHLPPGARARVYVRIPLWARLALGASDGVTLVEIPTLVMSDTWWGDFVAGELAFWLPTRARRHLDAESFEPHVVICPLALENESPEVLPVERLAVRVAHMTIYKSARGLWANEMRVRYERDGEGSRIDMDDGPPPEADAARAVTEPRHRPERGLRALTFGRLRQVANL